MSQKDTRYYVPQTQPPQFTLSLQSPILDKATTLSPCETSGKQALAGLPEGSSGGFSGAPLRHPIPILLPATQFESEATDILPARSCRAACIALPVVMCHDLDPRFSHGMRKVSRQWKPGRRLLKIGVPRIRQSLPSPNWAEYGRGHYPLHTITRLTLSATPLTHR